MKDTSHRFFIYSIYDLEYFDDVNLVDREDILEALTTLAADKDADVREAACALGRVQPVPPPTTFSSHQDNHSSTLTLNEVL